jgi:hypothetical protein
MIFNELQEFRQKLYDTLGNARDAVFDLMDAVKREWVHCVVCESVTKSGVSPPMVDYLCSAAGWSATGAPVLKLPVGQACR